MPIFRFQALWKNHPAIKGDVPVLDKKVYENQCAINLSAAFTRSGISLQDYRGALSWEKDKPKYAIRAQELADWLRLKPRFPGSFAKLSAKDFSEKVSGKSGVIFFQNYWGPGSQGDHIDLWDGSRLTARDSWARINLRVGGFGLHSLGFGSDLHKAESVWFWAIS